MEPLQTIRWKSLPWQVKLKMHMKALVRTVPNAPLNWYTLLQLRDRASVGTFALTYGVDMKPIIYVITRRWYSYTVSRLLGYYRLEVEGVAYPDGHVVHTDSAATLRTLDDPLLAITLIALSENIEWDEASDKLEKFYKSHIPA